MDNTSYTIRVPKRLGRIAAIVGVLALIVAPLAAVATHSFDDVSNDNTFHADIEWLKAADVTRGCNPPDNNLFCPDDNVTREQMSAFMKRLAENRVVDAGALEGNEASDFVQKGEANTVSATMVTDESGAAQNVEEGNQGGFTAAASSQASASISVPDDGYVLVIASAEYYLVHATGTTSSLETGISTSPTSLGADQDKIYQIPSGAPSGTYATSISTQKIIPVTAGTHTFHLVGRSGDSASLADATVSLVYLSTAYGTVNTTSEASTGSDTP